MSFESFDEMATDCVDRDEVFTPMTTFDTEYIEYDTLIFERANQARTEREIVECRELESTYCDICGKKVDGLVFIAHVRPWICLHYCEEHYKTRSDYIKELELDYIEATS